MKFLIPFLAIVSATAKPLTPEEVERTAHKIDQVLESDLKARSLAPNPVIDDATFLRRSYLNIIGRLPTHDEARVFLRNENEDKRSRLIDSLVDSPGFNSRLFNFWSDLLRLKTREESHGLGWHVWLKKAIESDMPYDEMVNAMLSAEGHVARDPAAGYYLRDRGMLLDNVSNTVQVFLGQQIGCAQCHDHPFDDTTQMEYYQLAAFLGGTEYRFDEGREKVREVIGGVPLKQSKERVAEMSSKERRRYFAEMKKRANTQREKARTVGRVIRYHQRNALSDSPGKDLKLPADYQYEDGKPGDVVKPGFLFGLAAKDVAPEQRREYFANWVTSPKNPYFTKVIANRLWEYTFGYGLVADPDDWSNSPEPLHPELVDLLAETMQASDYRLREFLRVLFQTRLFEQEVSLEAPSQGFSFAFVGPILRRLGAEEIRDSFITLASGNVDSTTNDSLEETWNEYVESFDYLMNTSPKEFREISKVFNEAEQQRINLQRELSLLRSKAQKARDEGKRNEARELFAKIQKVQKKYRNQYGAERMSSASESVQKASPALARRAPYRRPSEPEFRMRASELPVPARGGSLLAEFGAADAESPSSAHTEATIPQILRLLNGVETSLLTNRKNSFARSLLNLESPEERLEYLFLSLYSSFPSDSEIETFLPEVQTPEDAANLARAILTSNRFLFVQ